MKNQEKKQIRILHTSDIHIDDYSFANNGRPDGRPGLAMKALVDFSILAKANMVVVAGDFFDYNPVDTETVQLALQELRRVPVPVIILPGNHDCLDQDSIYQRVLFSELAPNVHVFTAIEGERFSFPELDLAIWGKPISSHGDDFRPMGGVPPRGRERWQIAVAHGYYTVDSNDRTYSLQILEEEVVRSSYDYVALGHSAGFRCACDGPVKAYYSGSPSLYGTVIMVDLIEEGSVQVCAHQLPL